MSIPVPDNPDLMASRTDELEILEIDETIPPRPEEEVADALRAATSAAMADQSDSDRTT